MIKQISPVSESLNWRADGRCDLCPIALMSVGLGERTVSLCNGKCIEADRKVEIERARSVVSPIRKD